MITRRIFGVVLLLICAIGLGTIGVGVGTLPCQWLDTLTRRSGCLHVLNVAGFHGSVLFDRNNSVAYSPDGTMLAAGLRNGATLLWRVSDGSLLFNFGDLRSQTHTVAFSSDGTILAAGGGCGKIRLWQTRTGALLNTLEGHTSSVEVVAFSPDGAKLASGGRDNTVRIWQVSTGTLLEVFSGYEDFVNGLAFSPDGTKLVSAASSKKIQLTDIASRQVIWQDSGEGNVEFSPSGQILAGREATRLDSAKLWRASNGQLVRRINNTFAKLG